MTHKSPFYMLICTKKINSGSILPEPVDIGLGLREHDVDRGGTNGQGLCHIRRAPAVSIFNHNLCEIICLQNIL